MTSLTMNTYELNDLMYALENSTTASQLLEYIDSAMIGPTQPCCDYCESLLEAERNQ